MMEWISVDERLPEDGDFALCHVRHNFGHFFQVMEFINGYFWDEDEEYCTAINAVNKYVIQVTHWAELTPPQPAAEENK